MAEKLTMADIAELAGVTKSTVSRYFNGGSIKEETRKKIQNVVEETVGTALEGYPGISLSVSIGE